MESRMICGFEHANFNPPPLLLFRSTPLPFTAINKFLELAHGNNSTNAFYQQNKPKSMTAMNDFGAFSSSSNGNFRVNNGGFFSCPSTKHHEIKFVNGLFSDGHNHQSQSSEISQEVASRNEEFSSFPSNVKRSRGKKSKGLKEMIKGQWTEAEDSMLIELVKQHGEKRWAKIASYLMGRAGKQCRERWHNHLRPDIKKDAWDEEEERMLVAAHEEYENQWAKIAKKIPGRTENSIKNHWNATKRRQTSRLNKKNKLENVGSNNNQQPSVLQNYIKRKMEENNNHPNSENPNKVDALEAVPTSPISAGSTIISGDPPTLEYSCDEPSHLMTVTNTCQDELVFFQQLFSNNNCNNNNNNNNVVETSCESVDFERVFDLIIMNSLAMEANHDDEDDNNVVTEQFIGQNYHQINDNLIGINPTEEQGNYYNNKSGSSFFYSDNYLADLLNGGGFYHQGGDHQTQMNYQPYNQNGMMEQDGYFAADDFEIKKDMDLIEMIMSSPQFSQSSSTSSY